jgi:leader peptidase (prepilin peptidase)/N-methyltransferase
MLDLFVQSPLFTGGSVFLMSLCIGSFLNVVVYRLPIMLERRWQAECREVLGQEPLPEQPVFNLGVPRSRCPHCGHLISAIENIPVISWIALRGRCRACKAPISRRYPLVELATALLSLLVLATLGPTAQALYALPLTWALIALVLIDADTQLLPDDITLPLLWAGLLVNLGGTFVSLPEAVLGAVAGYVSLWSIFWLYKLLTGKNGMGYGDFKLLAAIGAWLGWKMLLPVVLLSSVSGALVGAYFLYIHRKSLPFAFGPFLAVGGFIALLWGPQLLHWYLGLSTPTP